MVRGVLKKRINPEILGFFFLGFFWRLVSLFKYDVCPLTHLDMLIIAFKPDLLHQHFSIVVSGFISLRRSR